MRAVLTGMALGLYFTWFIWLFSGPSGKDFERACRAHRGIQQVVTPGFPPLQWWQVVCRDGTVHRP